VRVLPALQSLKQLRFKVHSPTSRGASGGPRPP
jgi:hypothetical protein